VEEIFGITNDFDEWVEQIEELVTGQYHEYDTPIFYDLFRQSKYYMLGPIGLIDKKQVTAKTVMMTTEPEEVLKDFLKGRDDIVPYMLYQRSMLTKMVDENFEPLEDEPTLIHRWYFRYGIIEEEE
jgi:hypothetical protein